MGPFNTDSVESFLLIGGVTADGFLLFLDLDCGLDFLDLTCHFEGEGVESGQAQGGISASPDGNDGISGVEHFDFAVGDGVVAEADVDEVDVDFGFWVEGWVHA